MAKRENSAILNHTTSTMLQGRISSTGLVAIMVSIVMSCAMPAICSSGRSVELGENNTGTITTSDPDEGEDFGGGLSTRWWYHVYYLNVEAGHPYTFTLTTHNDVTTGIWSDDKGGWIVEVNPIDTSRTATYRFERSGRQELWVEAAEVPAEYSWHVTR